MKQFNSLLKFYRNVVIIIVYVYFMITNMCSQLLFGIIRKFYRWSKEVLWRFTIRLL